MYEITINSDETITIDPWKKRIMAAREIRPRVWFEVMDAWREKGGVLDFDASPVQELFLEMRIDMSRAHRMLDERGATSAAPIDPIPELAEENESQMLREELVNDRVVFEALEARLGKTCVNFGRPSDVELFVTMRESLAAEGKILPGLRGA